MQAAHLQEVAACPQQAERLEVAAQRGMVAGRTLAAEILNRAGAAAAAAAAAACPSLAAVLGVGLS